MTKRNLTEQDILDQIKSAEFHVFQSKQTVCCLTLNNGFTIIGESACVDPANYDADIGNAIAHKNAVNKVWMVEGYLLQEKLYGVRNAT